MIQKRSKEEICNSFTHLCGVIAAIPAGWLLITRGFLLDSLTGVAMAVFACAIVLMYTASTLYHWAIPGEGKRLLRKLDHANIYVLIAASYTPVWLCVVGGAVGWIGFGALWFVTVVGVVYKCIALEKYPKLSLTIYLVMGWSLLFVIKPIWNGLPTHSLWWLVVEGVCYTGGTYFYAHHRKPYFHAIWHLCVLGGTFAHFMAMLQIVTP